MAPEEHNPKCSSTSTSNEVISGGGVGDGGDGGDGGDDGDGSKICNRKLKHKGIPQRGVGIAQLERLKLEEQLKKGEASVNAFSRASPLLSASRLQMERPPNQCYYGNNNNVFRNEAEKTTVLKRQRDFAPKIWPPSQFHNFFPSTSVSQLSRSGESASWDHVLLDKHFQGTITILRESSSSGPQFETNSREVIPGNDCLDYSFLTLAPPTSTPEESPRTTKGLFEDPVQRGNTSELSSGSSGQQPFFYFIPMPNLENGESSFSREAKQPLDLDLKL